VRNDSVSGLWASPRPSSAAGHLNSIIYIYIYYLFIYYYYLSVYVIIYLFFNVSAGCDIDNHLADTKQAETRNKQAKVQRQADVYSNGENGLVRRPPSSRVVSRLPSARLKTPDVPVSAVDFTRGSTPSGVQFTLSSYQSFNHKS
jgi:hypothetical protein